VDVCKRSHIHPPAPPPKKRKEEREKKSVLIISCVLGRPITRKENNCDLKKVHYLGLFCALFALWTPRRKKLQKSAKVGRNLKKKFQPVKKKQFFF
jgi:hypothetical protein